MFKVGDRVKCIDPTGPLRGEGLYYVRRLCVEDSTMMEVSETLHGPAVPRRSSFEDTRDAWNMSRFAPIKELRLGDVRHLRGVWKMRDYTMDQEVMVTDGLGNAWHGARGKYCCDNQHEHVLEPTALKVEQFMRHAPPPPEPRTPSPAPRRPRARARRRMLLV